VGSRQAENVHDYLERQRWFAGKGRDFQVERIHPLSWLSQPKAWPAVRVELVTVRYSDDGSTETYQLPVGYRARPSDNMAHAYIGAWTFSELLNRPVMAYDALHDKESTALWLAGLLEGRTLPDLVFHRLGQLDIDPAAQSLVLTAEQSNTSLVFGEATLLKVFRRVHHGPNPDIEIHEALTKGEGDNIAKLHGWLEAEWPGESGEVARGDLGMFSDFFRTASNGWELAITSVRDLYAEGDLHADEVGGDFASESFRLGATTAEIHGDLARVLIVDTWGREELSALADAMRERLTAAAGIVPALQPFVKGLRSAFDDLAAIEERVQVQRVHGDLHLGQTMRTVGGWRIIDFEGEPAKLLEARRALDSPLRDVAGMLRSYDYAAQHLLMQHDRADEVPLPGSAPGPASETNQLAYRAEEWSDRNRDAFCRGYARVSGIDPREQSALLRAYETDKAVYEVVYESRTRPDWIGVPLSAIERLAG
jgi:maltokinase